MQSRFESPSLNSTLSADQRLMERAREAAIRVRKEEQENIVLARKRKLKDLCEVARQIEWNKALSGHYVFTSGPNEIDDIEGRFLELNDLLLGRLYDESTLQKLFASTFSASTVIKQSISSGISGKSIASQQCPSVQTSTISQVSPLVLSEVYSNEKESSIKLACSAPPQSSDIDTVSVEDTTWAFPVAITELSSPKFTKSITSSSSPSNFRTSPTPPVVPELPSIDVGLPSEFLEAGKTSLGFDNSCCIHGAPRSNIMVSPPIGDILPSGELPETSQQPPPLQSLKQRIFTRTSCQTNGGAAVESDTPSPSVVLPKRDPTGLSIKEQPPCFVPLTHVGTPILSHPHPIVIPPVLRIVSSPIPSPDPHHRQNNVSSPITSEDEDDDRDNGVVISSATSPDANNSLPDQSRTENGYVEALQKQELVVGMSDPSAQLRFEVELSRKDQGGTEIGPTLTSSDKLMVCSDHLHTYPRSTSEQDGQLSMTEISLERSLSRTIENYLPEISVAPLSSLGITEENSPSNASPADYQPTKDLESIPTVVTRFPFSGGLDAVPSPSDQGDRTLAALSSPSSMSSINILANKTILSDTLLEATVVPHAKLLNFDPAQNYLLKNGEIGSPEPPVIAKVEDGASELFPGESYAVPREYPDATNSAQCDTPGRKVKLPADVDLDAQSSTGETIVDKEPIVTSLDKHIEKEKSKSELTAASNGFVFANRSSDGLIEIMSPLPRESVSLSALGSVEKDRGSSFAIIQLGKEQRRKNNEGARLAKVVFAGESPDRGIQPHGAKPLRPGYNSQQAKFSPGVINFFLHSTKARVHPLSTDISPAAQLSRSRVPSAISHHEHQCPRKDYLTPYFQLEAFEQPLQSLLQSSHKTLLTANHQLCIKEQQTKKVYRRIQELQEKGLWSLRQPVRVREPSRKLCHWDYLVQEAGWLSIDFKQERRFKIAQCKILADMIMEWHVAKPGHRKFLCVDKAEVLREKIFRARRSSPFETPILGEQHFNWSKNDAGKKMKLDKSGLIPAFRQSPVFHESCGVEDFQPFLARAVDWRHDGHGQPHRKWNIEVDSGDFFDYLSTPPVQLFTLGPQETLFGMPLTNTANEVLSELPLQVPPTLPLDPCILDGQEEDIWQIPLAPVSKLCVARLLVNDGGPPRKRSRYEYEENYNLFADGYDSDDSPHTSTPFFSSSSTHPPQPQKPVPLPPESTNVALFNPDFKHILNRMQGHHFKPPSFIPPVPFFEHRLASQWLPSEDEKLKDLVQRYPQNWALISTFMTFKGDLQSAPERRSPWECFERYLQIEQPSAEFSKSPYYRGIQQRLEASGKASLSNLASGNLPSGNGGSGSSTPTIRRRGNAPLRVERRKNSKFVHLFESMRKLAKRRELSLTKQQNAVGAANRKAEQQSQNKPKLNNFVPAHFSKMKYEREMKIERQARENAALVAQQRAAQSVRTHPGAPYTSSHGIPVSMQRHAQPPRHGTPSRNSPVVTSANPTVIPQVSPGAPVPRASPSVAHVLPNGIVPASGGAPVPGMAGIPLSGVTGLPGQLNGAPTASAIALGLRHHSGVPGPIHAPGYTQQQIQYLKLKLAQQHQAAQAAAASQQAQNGSHSVSPVAIGSLASNYSQHAIIAAQQQAMNAAASTASMKHQPNGVNSESNSSNAMSPQQRPQLNVPGPGQAGSPRPPQQIPLLTTPVSQQIATWVRSQNPTLSTEQLQKLTEQRLSEYHSQIRQQLTNVQLQGTTGFPAGINGGVTTQPLYQQQALRQQHLIIQQQSRQGSQAPAQLPQTTVVGGVVSRGTTPQNCHLLQRSASMQSVGHSLQRTQSLGQQGHVQVQQQSPRQTQVQQAQMTGIPQVPSS